MNKNKRGFTIIEVVLFLALSAGFFLIIFIGIGPRTRQVQFSEGMRDVETYMKKQYEFLFSGVNSRSAGDLCDGSTITDPGEDTGCFVMGRAMSLTADSSNIDTIEIIGNNYTVFSASEGISFKKEVTDAHPRISRVTTKVADWGIKFVEGKYMLNDTTEEDFRALGFIRSPYGGPIVPVVYRDEAGLTPPNNLALDESVDSKFYFFGDNFTTSASYVDDFYLCFEDADGRTSQIIPSTASNLIELEFVEDCGF